MKEALSAETVNDVKAVLTDLLQPFKALVHCGLMSAAHMGTGNGNLGPLWQPCGLSGHVVGLAGGSAKFSAGAVDGDRHVADPDLLGRCDQIRAHRTCRRHRLLWPRPLAVQSAPILQDGGQLGRHARHQRLLPGCDDSHPAVRRFGLVRQAAQGASATGGPRIGRPCNYPQGWRVRDVGTLGTKKQAGKLIGIPYIKYWGWSSP